ncbi:hypothetical protein [Paenibacillus thalictri]|uniref:hypothetical protein n=1 Tax=Paenibacillus thalictri TaxID=2527873 RepID=UPI0013EEEDCC|nr:hypothetical protein [Paenibacillus thalictri]
MEFKGKEYDPFDLDSGYPMIVMVTLLKEQERNKISEDWLLPFERMNYNRF